MNSDDFCELCELTLSQCPHGQPKPVPVEPVVAAPKVRKAAAPKAPSAPRAKKGPVPVTKKAAVRRWTSSDELEPLVVQILDAAGGTLGTDEMLAQIEERIAEQFRSGDCDRTPTGELRWHLAARKARLSLVNQGVMTKEQPGTWTLS